MFGSWLEYLETAVSHWPSRYLDSTKENPPDGWELRLLNLWLKSIFLRDFGQNKLFCSVKWLSLENRRWCCVRCSPSGRSKQPIVSFSVTADFSQRSGSGCEAVFSPQPSPRGPPVQNHNNINAALVSCRRHCRCWMSSVEHWCGGLTLFELHFDSFSVLKCDITRSDFTVGGIRGWCIDFKVNDTY